SVRKHAFGYLTILPPGKTKDTGEITANGVVLAQIEYAIILMLVPAYTIIKLSIIFFYRRLFVSQKNLLDSLLCIFVALMSAWGITFFLLVTPNCGTHPNKNWSGKGDLVRHCNNSLKYQQGFYISEFIMNIILIALPLPTIWRLHLSWRRKLAVTGIMLMAFRALVASIIRLVIILQITTMKFVADISFDVSRCAFEVSISPLFYWGEIEAGLALIASCLPTLKPLLSEQGIKSAINSVRSAISLDSIHNGLSANTSPKSYEASAYDKLEPGSTEPTPLRGDTVMELKSSATHMSEPERVLEMGRVRARREVSMREDIV
ncbi:hypothetical protein LSUE1_G008188, partial [Lachnellula suecica]